MATRFPSYAILLLFRAAAETPQKTGSSKEVADSAAPQRGHAPAPMEKTRCTCVADPKRRPVLPECPLRLYRLRAVTPDEADAFCAQDHTGKMRIALWFWRIVARAGGDHPLQGAAPTPHYGTPPWSRVRSTRLASQDADT